MFGGVRSLHSDRTLARARLLRSDRAGRALSRYVATEFWLGIGRYVATKRVGCSVATNSVVTVFDPNNIELNWNSSLLLGRSFLATVGAVCDMNKNKLCLTLIDPNIHYDPIRPKRKVINSVDYGKELGFIGACHCGAEWFP
ncbi:hypothetical protein F2Q68_00015504 [Brassica cretica]|uniref:Uncharacterized protein n=1 Tax=Brassica cretica TaxID=69181 RepID=A0A8S9HJM7_BRACR|nr:hypothetical protein F2Q68_00015504 [Brassica cretica]